MSKPKSEQVEHAVNILNSQPFPYVLAISEGFVDSDGGVAIHIEDQSHFANGDHAGAIVAALRDLADMIENEGPLND